MDASPRMPSLAPGSVLGGRYRLERLVASGGMASVWEAHDDVLARSVAVKVLHAHLGADEQFVARFKREAVAAARLAHPSIVAIYDTCSGDGVEAIVMELVRGPTLRAELDRRGRFDPHDAARVVAEVADALGAAHAAGIVHRDVKPANVLLSTDGRVLVADFGIAKAGDGLDLTGTGTTLGTAKYLAPEQVDASIGPVDARADVYAAGVILYELLAGSPPFVADTEAGTALARLHRDAPDVATAVDGVPDALAAVCRRALARDPAARFASASELRDALRGALVGIPPPDGPPTAPVTVVGPDPTTVVVPDGTRVTPGATTTAPPTPPRHQRAEDRAPEGDGPGRPRTRRRWAPIVLSSIVVVALAVAGVLWATIGDDDGDTPEPDPGTGSTAAPAGEAIEITAVRSFDPEGDGGENEDDVAAAVDGDPSTTWRTECYASSAFGNLKDGVGVVVALAERAAIGGLRIESPDGGWTADAYVADDAGDELADWGTPVGQVSGTAGTTAVSLDGAEGRFVLLWFTSLPASCDGGNPFGVSVGELSVV